MNLKALPQENLDTAVNILAILNSREFFSKISPQLFQYGYRIEIVLDMNEAIASIKSKRPDVILLSWNSKNISVVKTYTFFTEKLKCPCLVFAEDQTPRVLSSLSRSRIPNTLFPPLSGHGIHRRVELLLRARKRAAPDKNKQTSKPSVKAANTFGTIKVVANDIEPTTTWEDSGPIDSFGNRSWKGTELIKDKKRTYYYKGSTMPTYDEENSKWENLDEASLVLMQEKLLSDSSKDTELQLQNDAQLFSMIEEENAANDEKFVGEPDASILTESLLEDLKLAAEESSDQYQSEVINESPTSLIATAIKPLSVEERSHLKNVLADCIIDVLEGQLQGVSKNVSGLGQISKLAAMALPSEKYNGYLLYAEAGNRIDENFINQYYRKLESHLKTNRVIEKKANDVFEISMPDFNFKSWAEKFASFTVAGNLNGQEISFAYMALSELPIIARQEQFLALTYENWLVPNSELLFDLYLHMPANQKYLLYLKKGTLISKQVLNKFLRLNVKNLFIEPAHRNSFLEYCIFQKITANLKA
jgi:hypothetical protein